MPTSGWSNNVVTTGTPTFFTAPTGTNPSFVPASGDTMLTGKGATGSAVPTADIGLDPKCLVKRTPVMVGQVARVSTWQYDVDIDYIKSIGGVAKCFNPKARSGTPDIGAYRPGTVTTAMPGSCVAPPITGAGGSGGASGASGAGGSGGSGWNGAARAEGAAAGGAAGTAGAGTGGATGTARRARAEARPAGRAGPRAAGRPEAAEPPRGWPVAVAGSGGGAGSLGGARRGGGGSGTGGAGAPPAGSGGSAGRNRERRQRREVRPRDRARASRRAAAATCLDRATARERSRLSGSWRSARRPSGAGAARDQVPAADSWAWHRAMSMARMAHSSRGSAFESITVTRRPGPRG